DMFGGATDTSATTLEWTMSELMKNPRVMKKVQTEIRETFKGKKRIYESDLHELSYMKSVIKETMRLHPPATLILRECIKACKLSGYEIPIKTQVMVNLWALGRDPNHWDDAEKFMPESKHGASSGCITIPLQLGNSKWNETRGLGYVRSLWSYGV
ncbi:cytochrome p450 71d8-like protein, partial [Trifolium pratense]